MTARARIAVLKPDFGVAGGFERVVGRVESILTEAGHEVTRLTVDMTPRTRSVDDLEVPTDVWDAAPEFFPYVAARTRFDRLATSRYDLVLSTQPPSFSHRHRRHLALFYHHHRLMYDLLEPYLAAGFSTDPEVHRAAAEIVRRLDQPRLESVTTFLTPSDAVADRLARFNGITGTDRFLAGVGVGTGTADRAATPAGRSGRRAVLCVGRHEFPKRCELLVAAAHLVGDVPVHIVGSGGRLAFARELDRRLTRGELDPGGLDDAALWCNTGRAPSDHESSVHESSGAGTTSRATSRPAVRFSGWIDDGPLTVAYRDAPCVVAPALDEDYGLTAIEAMTHGRPVIVCRDGGGLAELVDHEVTGLVVEPTPTALAAAIRRLVDHPDLAAELGRNGRERASQLTWRSAGDQLLGAVTRTLDT